MKIKKILIYLIFAFVMILPFSVNAESKFIETGVNLDIFLYSEPLKSNQIVLIEEIIMQKINSSDFNYFVVFSPSKNGYRVYLNEAGQPFYFMPYISETSGRFSIDITARNYFEINFNTMEVSNLHFSAFTYDYNDPIIYDFLSDCEGFYKDEVFYPMKFAPEELGIDFYDISTFNNLHLISKIVYSNSEFITAVNPRSFADLRYSGLSKFAGWDIFSTRFNDYPIFKNSNIPISQGVSINLTPALDDYEFFDEDVMVTYNYNGADTNSIEVNVLIADKPYTCSGTFLGSCVNKKNKDYIDFNIIVDGTIYSKIYFSKDGVNFVKSGSSFVKTSNGYSFSVDTLNADKNGYKSAKFVISLSKEQNAIFTIKYNSKYLTVEMPTPSYDDSLYTEYDMTGKYAVGLIPKTNKLNANFKYIGNFISYFSYDNDPYAYEYSRLNSTDYILKGLDFTPFLNKENPIFYIINTNSSNVESVAKIKYLSNFFELIYFDDYTSVVTYDGYTYVAPDSNTTVKSLEEGGTSNSSSSSGIDLSLTSLVSKLPDLISGLGNAFKAVGDCIVIAFTSLPEIVQSVLYISLIVTVILIAIKLIK